MTFISKRALIGCGSALGFGSSDPVSPLFPEGSSTSALTSQGFLSVGDFHVLPLVSFPAAELLSKEHRTSLGGLVSRPH